MPGRSGKALIVMTLFAVLNVGGLVWIHHDLTNTPRATVRLLSASLQPDADNPDRVVLAFDREMVSEASIGQVEKAGVFQFAPACPGRWIWSGRNTLEYLLETPLPSGCLLKGSATPRLKQVTGRTLEGAGEFELAARPLRFVSAEVVACDRSDITLQLNFNQPVDPGELLRHVSFCDARTRVRLGESLCLTKTPQKDVVVRFGRPESNRFRLVLDADLAGAGAAVGLGRPVVIEREVEPGFALLDTNVYGPNLDEVTSVELHFSEMLDTRQPLPRLTAEPAVGDLQVRLRGSIVLVTGKFQAGRRYSLRVPGTLLSRKGETLTDNVTVALEVPDYYPRIVFEHSRGILSPRGHLALDARGVNVEQLELRAWRVHGNNLVPHLHGTDIEETSQSLLDKTVAVKLPHNKPGKLVLGLQELLSHPLGIYHVETRVADHRWTRDSAIVTVTDLALTVKRDRDGYLVWVTSLRSAEPVADVVVEGLTFNNQRVAAARTDQEGIARLRFGGRHPEGGIWVVTAAKDGDLSYVQPDENEWVIDSTEHRGRPYADEYEAMLYTDRGVYRPGETVHLTGIIRDTAGRIAPRFPLSLKVRRPDGRQVAELAVSRSPQDQGLFHTSFTPSAEAQTGPYRFCVTLPGSDDLLGSTGALVEAFVPVRMEVTAAPSAARFGPNEPPTVRVTARYLWNQPASALPATLEGTLRPVAFHSPICTDFRFGSERQEPPISLSAVEGKLDDGGQGQLSTPLPETLKPGLYEMHLSATVTEPGGRSVSANTSAALDLLDTHIGLRLAQGQMVPAGERVPVDWVRRTGQDRDAAPGEMTRALVRVEYDTVLKQVDDRYVWQSVERTENVGKEQTIAAVGTGGSFDILCPDAGSYRVIVTDSKSGSTTCLPFYACRPGEGSQSVPMNQPERVEIVTDKPRYAPGDRAKVLLRSPIPGTVLLAVETDRVLAHQIARIKENTCELEVTLPAEVRGSVYLTASVLRAVDPNEGSWLPHRGLGTLQVPLDHTGQRLAVGIDASAQVRPGETISVTVDAGRPVDANEPTRVHLWAVDEGILLTCAYQTPDVHEFFLGPRTPGVSTADVFDWLLPDFQRPAGMVRIGGDGFDVDALRRNPVAVRTRAPAVVWQEAAATDGEGKLTVRMSLPELTGQLRIMAVAVDHDRYGTAQRALTVTAPLLLETSWPRCAAPGDRFTVPAKLFNATEQPITVRLAAKVSGPLELTVPEANDIVVPPGRPVMRLLQARATAIGPVEVKVEAQQQGAAATPLRARSAATLPVRPATALHSVVELKAVPAGRELRIEPPDIFLAGTVRTTVSVSARPSVELAGALEEQIRYPYGCVEQTSSRLLSLLYAPAILDPNRAKTIDAMVKAGIARLWSMQTSSGGLSYWPGGVTPTLWGTAYAASCLLEARDAGYEIDRRFTDELAKYLESELRSGNDEEADDLNTRALLCRVLAGLGEPPRGWMARLAEQKDRLDVAALAHLAQAFAAVGDKERALSLLPDSPPVTAIATTTSRRLTSQVRQEAVWLSALLDIEPNHPMTAPLAAGLNKARSNGQWGSTLNNAAVIAALSRYQALTSRDEPRFTGVLRVGSGPAVRFGNEEPACVEAGPRAHPPSGQPQGGAPTVRDGTEPIQLSSEGQGTIYVVATHRGLIREDLVQPYDRQLHVERRWMDRDGRPIDPNNVAVGDLVRVEVVVRGTGGTIDNIAVVDALPAGMEVENPRLATSAQSDSDSPDLPDHVEFLDDRVVLFGTADSHPRTYRYALRAITAGQYVLPPIQASCMYDPSVASLGAVGHVVIRNP